MDSVAGYRRMEEIWNSKVS